MKHSGQKAGRNLLAAVFHNCLTGTVVKCDVTALAAFGIEADRDATCMTDLKDLVNECLAFHDLQYRTGLS